MAVEKKTYSFAYQSAAYEAQVPERFLRPLYIRLPDERILMQKYRDGPWQDVTELTGKVEVVLKIYDAVEVTAGLNQADTNILSVLQDAMLVQPAGPGEQGDVYVARVDGGTFVPGGKFTYAQALLFIHNKKRLLNINVDATTLAENEIAGLWIVEGA